MKIYYTAQVRVIIDGNESLLVPISGKGYNPNEVKRIAENRIRENNIGKIITSVVLKVEHMNQEEFRRTTGGKVPFRGDD